LRQTAAGFHIGSDIQQQPRDRRVRMAARDDIERLQQRHSCFEHRRQLPCEYADILFMDPALTLRRFFLHPYISQALPTQCGIHARLHAGAHFTLYPPSALVLTFPEIDRVAALTRTGLTDRCHANSPDES